MRALLPWRQQGSPAEIEIVASHRFTLTLSQQERETVSGAVPRTVFPKAQITVLLTHKWGDRQGNLS